jgi:hypothetical protein
VNSTFISSSFLFHIIIAYPFIYVGKSTKVYLFQHLCPNRAFHHNLIRNQGALLRDDAALPFLAGGKPNVADDNPVTPTQKIADPQNPHSSTSTHQTIPTSVVVSQP